MINSETGQKYQCIGPTLRHCELNSSKCGIGFVKSHDQDLVVWFHTLPTRLAKAWMQGAKDAFLGRPKRELYLLAATDEWYAKGYELMKEQL